MGSSSADIEMTTPAIGTSSAGIESNAATTTTLGTDSGLETATSLESSAGVSVSVLSTEMASATSWPPQSDAEATSMPTTSASDRSSAAETGGTMGETTPSEHKTSATETASTSTGSHQESVGESTREWESTSTPKSETLVAAQTTTPQEATSDTYTSNVSSSSTIIPGSASPPFAEADTTVASTSWSHVSSDETSSETSLTSLETGVTTPITAASHSTSPEPADASGTVAQTASSSQDTATGGIWSSAEIESHDATTALSSSVAYSAGEGLTASSSMQSEPPITTSLLESTSGAMGTLADSTSSVWMTDTLVEQTTSSSAVLANPATATSFKHYDSTSRLTDSTVQSEGGLSSRDILSLNVSSSLLQTWNFTEFDAMQATSATKIIFSSDLKPNTSHGSLTSSCFELLTMPTHVAITSKVSNRESEPESTSSASSLNEKAVQETSIASSRQRSSVPYILSVNPAEGYTGKPAVISVSIARSSSLAVDNLSVSARALDLNVTIIVGLSLIGRNFSSDLMVVNTTLFAPNDFSGVCLVRFDSKVLDAFLFSFNFTFLSLPLMSIVDFYPRSDNIYGGAVIKVSVVNVPVSRKWESFRYLIESSESVASTAINVTVEGKMEGKLTTVDMFFRAPPVLIAGSMMPLLILSDEKGVVQLHFPSNFTYLVPPSPAVLTIKPTSADIGVSTTVSILVSNFPPFEFISDIVAIYYWNETNTTSFALVKNAVISAAQASNLSSVQIDIVTPDCDGARAGFSMLTLFQRTYSEYPATYSDFRFWDFSNPQVSALQLIGSSPVTGSLRLPINKPQSIFLSLQDAPANSDAVGYTVRIQHTNASITFAAFNSEQRSISISLALAPTSVTGSLYGIVVFGLSPTSCNSVCCSDESCARESACQGAKTACFQLEYFDDSLPWIRSQSQTSG